MHTPCSAAAPLGLVVDGCAKVPPRLLSSGVQSKRGGLHRYSEQSSLDKFEVAPRQNSALL